ncbi:zonular occludens toxin domain-containing protein [Pseudomonas aeruginosa]|nr:zonular occludens toxin domain-containing protein [Pseudomonas aeruginosa]
MAIDAYVGKPGHGKSYGVVEHVIIPSLKQDRHVVTNIPLEVDMLLMDFGGTIEQLPEDWFERHDLADFAPPGSVLVLDELWRRWPKGQKTNDAPMADKKLLAEHRHRVDKKNRSMRVVMVTQDLDQLASWATLLVETTYRMVKKSKTMFRVDIYNGVAKGDSPPKSKLLRSTAGRFKPDVYRYYKSATQSETGAVGDESKADTRGSFWRSWGFWGLVGLIVVCLSVGIPGVVRFFTPPQPKQASAPTPAAKVVEQVQPVAAPAGRAMQAVYGSSSNGPVPSAIWRIAGYVHAGLGKADAWPSKDGYNAEPDRPISKTSRVVLVSEAGRTRFWPIEKCRFFEQTPDLYCDIDGERVTFWTGRGAVSTVMDATSTASGGSQRSAASAATGAQVQTPHSFQPQQPSQGTRVTVVSDNSRSPRTL